MQRDSGASPKFSEKGKSMAVSGRVRRNLAIALAVGLLIAAFYFALEPRPVMFRLSMGTAYTGLLLMAIALTIGPYQVLTNRRNPVSSYVRRDFGIWAGLIGVAHVIVGLQVHMGGKFWLYFVYPPDEWHPIPVRVDPFGLTNHAGLVILLILLLLLSLSNNASLRKLGAGRWKRLQQLAYVAAILTVAHGVIYQVLEERSLPFVALLAVIVLAAAACQIAGYRRRRARG